MLASLLSPPPLMAPKQPAESSAVKYTEPERTCLITEEKGLLLVLRALSCW